MDIQDNDQVGGQQPYFNELSRRISLAVTPNRLMPISEEPSINKHKYYNNSLRRAIGPDFGIKKIETVEEMPDSDEKSAENNLSTTHFAPIASSEASSFSLSNYCDSKNNEASTSLNENSNG